jgi:hypothetical protein
MKSLGEADAGAAEAFMLASLFLDIVLVAR